MTQESRKGELGPGWNDPPSFTYDKATEIQANAGKKYNLNKRISFPMSSGSKPISLVHNDPTIPISDGQLPPLPPPTVTSEIPQKQTISDSVIDKEVQLTTVLSNLAEVRSKCDDVSVSQRLKVMEKMWIEGKLNDGIKGKLLELSEALLKGNIDHADHIQRGLMVDYLNHCSSWMGAIRQVINMKR